MKNSLVTACVLVVLAGIVLTGGCVSEQKYKEALAMLRRANDQLENSQKALRDCRQENQGLQDQLRTRDAALKAKLDELALMETGNADLQKRLAELKDLYDRLSKGQGPTSIGPLPPMVDQALKALAKANPELLEYLPQYGMVKFKSDLTFEPGSDIVKPDAQDALRQFAKIVMTPEAARLNIYVAGHTDDMRIAKPETKNRHPDNWYLSVHRAVSVQQVLTHAGLEPPRIGAMGFGEYHPIAPNKPNKGGNEVNRRVEIWVVPPDRLLTRPGEAGVTPEPTPVSVTPGAEPEK